MANTYGRLGVLAQARKDYSEASRQYQRALAIFERLGNQVGMATTFSQLGTMEAERGGTGELAIVCYVKALAIRLRIGAPQAVNDLRRLAALRRELGPEQFTDLLAQATRDTDLAEAITSLLDRLDTASASGT